MMEQKKELTIEPAQYGTGVTVYEWGWYGKSSVLAGQQKKQYIDEFPTAEDAHLHYPTAEVCEGRGIIHNSLPRCAPDWFDPAAAGERWDDDY